MGAGTIRTVPSIIDHTRTVRTTIGHTCTGTIRTVTIPIILPDIGMCIRSNGFSETGALPRAIFQNQHGSRFDENSGALSFSCNFILGPASCRSRTICPQDETVSKADDSVTPSVGAVCEPPEIRGASRSAPT